MNLLNGLDDIALLVNDDEKFKPTNLDIIYYLFFKHGVTVKDMDKLPIPYIMRMVQMYLWEAELQKEKVTGSDGQQY